MRERFGHRIRKDIKGAALVVMFALTSCSTAYQSSGEQSGLIGDATTEPEPGTVAKNPLIRPDTVAFFAAPCINPDTLTAYPEEVHLSGIAVSAYSDEASGRRYIALLTAQHVLPAPDSVYAQHAYALEGYTRCIEDNSRYDIHRFNQMGEVSERYRVEKIFADPSKDVQIVIMSTDAVSGPQVIPFYYLTDDRCVGEVQFMGNYFGPNRQVEAFSVLADASAEPRFDNYGNDFYPTQTELGDVGGVSGSPGVDDSTKVCSVIRGYDYSQDPNKPPIHNDVVASSGGLATLASEAITTFARDRGFSWTPDTSAPAVAPPVDSTPIGSQEQLECDQVLDSLIVQACSTPNAQVKVSCHDAFLSASASDMDGDGVADTVLTIQLPPPDGTNGTTIRDCNQ